MSIRPTLVGAGVAALVAAVSLSSVGAAASAHSVRLTTASTNKSALSRTSSASSSIHIAFVCALPDLTFFAPVVRGEEEAAAAEHVDVSYTGIGASDITGPAMATALKAALAQHPSALIYCNFFPAAEDPIVKAASQQGTPVFDAQTVADATQDGALASFGSSDYNGGLEAAATMIAAGVKDPLCVVDTPFNPSTVARCKGLAAGFAAKGIQAITLNAEPTSGGSYSVTELSQVTKGELESHPNIDGIVMMGEEQAPAATTAVSAVGRTGKIQVGTFDISAAVLDAISNGTMLFAVWQQPYLQGYLPVVAAALYVRFGMTPVGETFTGPLMVTKSNVKVVQAAVAAGRA